MTSLVLTHYRPDKPTSGAPLRNWQNIRALASFGPVDVVTVGVEDARRPVEGLREWAPFSLSNRSAWDRFRKACAPLRPGIHPGIDLYYCSPVSSWLRKRGARGRYDVALIETIALAEYLDDLKQIANRVVFDAHNIESDLQPALEASTFDDSTPMVRRIKQRVLSQRLVSAERRVINGADLVWACSDEDARAIDRTYGRGTGVTVVPNGVDLDYYRRAGAPRVDADWSRLPVTMVYPGLFGYPPNDDAALRLIQQVLPGVRARGYSARIVLAGRNPTPALMAAAQRDAAVELTGAVESIVPHLDQPCIVTLPIAFGGGTRLKIVEAFAVGRPVVSTTKGAEGIDGVDGEHLFIRDRPEAMASAVIDLWNSPAMRAKICKSALDLARDRYSWSAATEQIAMSLGVRSRPAESGAGTRSKRAATYADGTIH